MKKIISALLCMTLLICSLCITSLGAAVPEVDELLYSKAAAILTELEIADEAQTLAPQGFITYNEFLGYLSNLTNSSKTDYAAYGIPVYMANEVVTYDAAVKIVVNLLGWSLQAEQKGYNAVANALNLTDGILNRNDAFARYDALMLIYNSLDADYLVQTKFGDKNEYSAKEDTILSFYKDIYEFSGIVKATKWSTVYSSAGLGDNKVTIESDDGTVTQYEYNGTASMDLLGVYVTGYYKSEDNFPEIISIHNDSDCIALYPENVPYCDLSARTIEYENNNGKIKTVSLPVNVTVVLNGRNCSDLSVINDETLGDISEVKIYKVDGKNKVVHILKCTSHVVETVSGGGTTLGFLNGGAVEFDDNEYGETTFFYDENDNEISFFDIEKSDIVSVYRSINNGTELPVMRVYVYDNSYSAKVVSCGDKNGEKYVNVLKIYSNEDGDVQYSDEVRLTYAFGFDSSLNPESNYKLYVDKFSRIVAGEYTSAGDGRFTGLYIKISSENSGLKNGYEIMMMPDLDSQTQAGAQILKISSRAKIDYEYVSEGVNLRKTVRLDNADVSAVNTALMHTAMYYYTDADGVVTKIIGYSSSQQNGYLYNFNPQNAYLGTGGISSQMILASEMRDDSGGRYGGGIQASFDENKPSTYFGGTTIHYGEVSKRMILLPEISSPDEVAVKYMDSYYKMISPVQYGIVVAQSIMKYNAFSHDGGLLPDYGTLVWNTDTYLSPNTYRLFNSTTGFLVDAVSWVETENGGRVMKLSGMLNTTAATLYTATDKIIDAGNSLEGNVKYFDEISPGDILLVQRNGNGDITVAIKICDYDPQSKSLTVPSADSSVNTLYRSYYDETTDTMVDELGMVNGNFVLNNALNSKKTAYVVYPYKLTKHAFNKASVGASFVVDPRKITDEPFPDTNPEQQELKLAVSTVMYFDTEAKDGEKRVGSSSMLNMVSYFDDPANMSKVFIYTVSNEPRFAVIYK